MPNIVDVCVMAGPKARESDLMRALKSARLLASGSDDRVNLLWTSLKEPTPFAAISLSDVWATHQWEGMGASRTRSLRLGTAPWRAYLDSDEYLVDDWTAVREDLDRLRADAEARCFGVMLWHSLEGGTIWRHQWQGRIFRPDVVFKNAVHCFAGVPITHRTQARVLHTGYELTDEEREEKYGVRLPDLLLQAESAATPRLRAYYRFQYITMLYQVSRWQDVIVETDKLQRSQIVENLEGEEALHLQHTYVRALIALHAEGAALDKDLAKQAAGGLARFGQGDPLMAYHAGLLFRLAGEPRGKALQHHALALAEVGAGKYHQVDPLTLEKSIAEDFNRITA